MKKVPRISFELNGQPRSVGIQDRSLATGGSSGFRRPGRRRPYRFDRRAWWSSFVEEGQDVEKGDKLLVLEAMKMETTIYAERSGTVDRIVVKTGLQVETGDLLVAIT